MSHLLLENAYKITKCATYFDCCSAKFRVVRKDTLELVRYRATRARTSVLRVWMHHTTHYSIIEHAN